MSIGDVRLVGIQPMTPGLVKTSTVAVAGSARTASPDGRRSWTLKFFSMSVVERMSTRRWDVVTPALKPTLPLAPAKSTPQAADDESR